MLIVLIAGSGFPVVPGLHVAVVAAVSFRIRIHRGLPDSVVGQRNIGRLQKLYALRFTRSAAA